MLDILTQQLARRGALTDDQVDTAVSCLLEAAIPAENKADFLIALAHKGETIAEISAFARLLREKSISPPIDSQTRSREILDVCGTGGDHLRTFNISTTVALLVASAGVTVAKHGNRAVTSQSGSADVLEALGIRVDLSPEEAAGALRDQQFAFFFAPNFHPAFKHIAPARKLCAARGERTIFNFLGPLLNPARPSAQLVGVPRPELCEPMARVLQSLGVRRAMVVCGGVSSTPSATPAFLDELSTLGENVLAEFYQDCGFASSTLGPANFPLQPATLADLAGGSSQVNAAIVRSILNGTERGPKRDAVLLNGGAALFVAGKVKSIGAGWTHAAELIDSGRAAAKLNQLISI